MFFTPEGFAQTWDYKQLFIDGLVCTISLSLLTVIFGFILALVIAVMRMSKWQPFRFLALDKNGHLREQGFLAALGLSCNAHARPALYYILCCVCRH